MEDILLLGLGGHAHSVVDSIEQDRKYNIVGFLDTEKIQGKQYKDYRVRMMHCKSILTVESRMPL